MAVDIAKSHVTQLSGFKRVPAPGERAEEETQYKVHWTTHQHGAYSRDAYVKTLRAMSIAAFCLPAECSGRLRSGKGSGWAT
jgi:hypothetical protein